MLESDYCIKNTYVGHMHMLWCVCSHRLYIYICIFCLCLVKVVMQALDVLKLLCNQAFIMTNDYYPLILFVVSEQSFPSQNELRSGSSETMNSAWTLLRTSWRNKKRQNWGRRKYFKLAV